MLKLSFFVLTTGQIVVSYLLDRGHQVRAVLRNKEKAEQIFGHEHDNQLKVRQATHFVTWLRGACHT